MKIDDLNTVVRENIQQIINKGFKKKPICDVTLGSSFNPQFNNFLNGENLGLVPLTRLMMGLGYDIHIVPIKKEDNADALLENIYNSFIENSNNDLINYLNNRPVTVHGNTSKGGAVNNALSDIVDDIMNNIE